MSTAMSVSAGVGTGQPNRPEDVLRAKAALHALGLYPTVSKATPVVDPELEDAIRVFQLRRDLRQDGCLAPDSVTVRRLDAELASLDEV